MKRHTLVVTGVVLAHAGLILLSARGLTAPQPHAFSAQAMAVDVLMPAPAAAAPPTPRARSPQLQQGTRQNTARTTPSSRESAAPADMPPHTAADTAVAPRATPLGAVAEATRPSPAAPVVLPSSDADYLHNPPPPYPRMSRRLGEQGTVVLRVFISAQGRAEKAEVRTSSGYPRLDEAALQAALQWRYVPGTRAGLAEAMGFNVPIRFVLD